MDLLTVKGLCKAYPGFALKDVSFSLRAGTVTGLIGRNGAGKTTALKSLVNLVHPDRGEMIFFGKPFLGNELSAKQQIGFTLGGIDYYPAKKIKTITAVTRRFYPDWDETQYRRYMQAFGLDEEKTPKALSEGMKVKYSLALALSHHARLLILDEPTSGLDPVSREEILDLFLDLAEQENVGILFSTHITSDLEKCADNIIYIRNGRILAEMQLSAFEDQYRLAELSDDVPEALSGSLIGLKREKAGKSALIKTANLPMNQPFPGVTFKTAGLDAIMVHLEKEQDQ